MEPADVTVAAVLDGGRFVDGDGSRAGIDGGGDARSGHRITRDALLLGGSAAILAVSGFAFWAVAARHLSPGELADANAVVSVGIFIAGVAQMNLVGSLPALLPTVGDRAPWLLLRCYAAAAAIAVVMAIGLEALGAVVSGVPHVGGVGGLWFILAVGLWTTFSIQDAALAATGQAALVPVENALYSLVRIALVVVLVAGTPRAAVLIGWFAPILLFIPLANWLILRQLRQISADEVVRPPNRRLLRSDAIASAFTQAQSRLVPFVAVLALSDLPAAELAMAWLFWTTADVFLGNLNVPLTVAVASHGRATAADVQRARRLALLLTGAGALAATVVSGPLLRLVLPDATSDGVMLVGFCLLSLVPRSLYHVALAIARGEHETRAVLTLPVRATVLLYGFLAAGFATEDLRITGAGVLASQVLLAIVAERWVRSRPAARERALA